MQHSRAPWRIICQSNADSLHTNLRRFIFEWPACWKTMHFVIDDASRMWWYQFIRILDHSSGRISQMQFQSAEPLNAKLLAVGVCNRWMSCWNKRIDKDRGETWFQEHDMEEWCGWESMKVIWVVTNSDAWKEEGRLPFFTKAARVCLFPQPSSASSERVFSQLTEMPENIER